MKKNDVERTFWRDDLDDRPVMVSIRCITYNHEKFIREALEGFVNQQTNFRFEAIVHDDASTDGTAEIIREYAERYPSIIKPIIETENQYSKHDGSVGRILQAHMRGKYIAMCEGDDYWTDPHKLQRQFDFMEAHPDCSLCFHNAMVHWENAEKPDEKFALIEDRDYTGPEVYKEWTIPTASTFFRREVMMCSFYERVINNNKFCFGDILVWLIAARLGKIRGWSTIMSVYRRHPGGVVFDFNIQKRKLAIVHDMEIPRVFGDEYISASAYCVSDLYMSIMRDCLKSKQYKEGFICLLKSFKTTPKMTIYCLRKMLHYQVKKLKL